MKQNNVFRHIFGWLLLSILCMGAAPVFAATISGTVYDSSGTAPITTGGYVDVYTSSGGPCDPITYTYVDTAIIDVDGTYTTTVDPANPTGILPVGDYYLKANSYGTHVPEWWADPASSPTCDGAQIVAVTTPSDSITGKNFQLDTGATISGIVNDSNGSPITVGGLVEVYASDPCAGTGYVTTFAIEADGTYLITGLPAGLYYLIASSNGNHIPEWWASPLSTPSCTAAQPVPVAVGAAVIGKDFQLDIGATISGTATDSATTAPITGGYVEAYTGNACTIYNFVGAGSLNPDGTYSITGLLAGDYLLKVFPTGNYISEWWASPLSTPSCTAAQTVPVTVGEAVIGKDFQLATGATISGTVYDDTGLTPIVGGGSVLALTGDICGSYATAGIGYIGPTGAYTIGGLAAGTYYLKAFPTNSYISEWWADPASTPLCTGALGVIVATSSDIFIGKNFQLNTSFIVTTLANPVAGGTVTGGGTYASGDTATLTAVPATGYAFTGWSSTTTTIADPLVNPLGFTVVSDTTITANFTLISYTVTTAALPDTGGTVTGGGPYLYGETATLTATPAKGFVFTGWSSTTTTIAAPQVNPLSFTVVSDTTITANFAPKRHLSFPVRAADGTIVIIYM